MEVYALTLVSANRCSQQNYVIDNLSDCLDFISEVLTDTTKYVGFKAVQNISNTMSELAKILTLSHNNL